MHKKQRRASRIAAQQDLVNKAKAAGRDLTDEENEQYEALQREIDQLTLEIDAEEEKETREAGGGQAAPKAPETAPAGNEEQLRQAADRAIAAERQRVQGITALCREFDLDPDSYVQNGQSLEQARAAVLEELRTHHGPVNARVTRDEEDKFRAAASDALLMRSGVSMEKPAAGANDFRHMSLRDLAIECMSREGRDTGSLLRMSPDEIYADLCRAFYNPSAAFPAIMDQTIEKEIVHMYNQVGTTFQLITTKGSLKDFKPTADHYYVIGGLDDFELVPENGEIKSSIPRTEILPQRKLDTYGKQFSMSRQAFINDDIGFMSEIPGLYASKAKQTIDKQVYRLLYDNPTIFDGLPLFCEKHHNIITAGTAPTQASIQAMITKMQLQADQFGDPIYVNPNRILTPVGYGFDLQVIFHSAQITGSANNDINPLYNYNIDTIQSPLLNAFAGKNSAASGTAVACPWFMLADPASALGIQVDYLNGNEIPIVRRMETAGTLGFTWDMFLDWGISVRDFRGLLRNDGVALEAA